MSKRIGARWKGHFPTHELFIDLCAIGLVALLVFWLGGCSPRQFTPYPYEPETKYEIESETKFASGPVHIVGRASCPYILLTIPLCKRQDLASIAFSNMYQQAKIEGQSALLVNVTHDASLATNFFYLFFIDRHAVSADVIVFEKISEE